MKLNQSWWCGYGPFDSPSIVVCAVIENGGHGGTAAAPAALQGLRGVLQAGTGVTTTASHRLMAIEAVDPRARGLRTRGPRRGATAPLGIVARLDWVLLAATLAAVAYGVWAIGGITRHDPGGSATSRQALYAAVGGVLLVAATLIDPALYRRFWRALYVGALRRDGASCSSSAPPRAARSAGSTSASSPSSRPSSGRCCSRSSLAAFLADNAKQIDAARRAAEGDRARRPCPMLLVFVQPDAGTALVYTAVLTAVLFVSGVRWLHLALIGGDRPLLACSPCSGGCPAAGCQRAQALPDGPPHQHELLQPHGVEDRRRLRRRPRPRRRRRDPDRARLPARRMRPTSRSPRSPSSAASSARPRSCFSTCSSSGAA